ncbi:type II secretion system secretin GspD [Hydrogenophaga defluvii]|uniref:Type II secretion system secretin GspD n=1 Tax=Hydrogenophaga defluvii TaxID=249410 RepID=A0ABW2SCF0_9BURK
MSGMPHPFSPRPLRVALLAALPLLAVAQTPLPVVPAPAVAARPGGPITLNFVNADIEAVARTMATLTGRNVVVDPRVKGNMTLSSETAVSPTQAFNQFTAALRLQGFAMVEAQGLYKVVPEAEAKLQSSAVSVANEGARAPAGNQIVTQIFRLNHESANNLVAVLRPLISPNNTINVNPGTNALVITDYADNLQRIGRIVAALDVSNASDVEVIPLRHALAADLAPMVLKLIESGPSGTPTAAAAGQGQTDSSFRTTLLAEPRSNALVLRAANPARVALVRSLVDKLDQPSSGNASGNIHVVYLKNADAVQLAATLRAAMVADGGGNTPASSGAAGNMNTSNTPRTAGILGTGNAAATAPVSTNAGPSTGGQIQADPTTNSLIITAPEPQYRQLRAVIDKLDTRRAQVYVESLIVEVSAEKAAEFGIQWQSLVGRAGNGVIGAIGTNFGGAATGNILNLAAQGGSGSITNLPQTGLNIALVPRINGTYYLGALARFLETEGDANVLSTPNLLTLDNEEAKIVIGQNVPFVTGQYTNNNSGGNGAVNPFQTIERKDVGLTLRVRPQIGEDGTVKMTLFQEVSSVVETSISSAAGPTTNKRSIESTVVVDDGAIIALGGLLQDSYDGKVDKVPGLGDVPIFGNLFKNDRRTRKKSNLMVFLRPVVMRDGRQADSLTQDRYDMLRASQQVVQPKPSSILSVNEAPVLPTQMSAPNRALIDNPIKRAPAQTATPVSGEQ